MITFPNCKINLGLSIIEKRDDNFHKLETIFYPIPLKDVLEIVPSTSKDINFHSSGLSISGDSKNNLVIKAYNLLSADYKLPGVKIHLHKNIPMGAGLGGGSSNAAFTFILLNKFFNLKISDEDLIGFASELGADCAFFIKNESVFATSKGEQFQSINISLKGKYIRIIKPNVHISTEEAYVGINPFVKIRRLNDIIQGDIADWRITLINDFEKHIFLKYPEIGQIKQELYEQGAIYAAMSGSGSSVFGIYENEPKTNDSFKNYFSWGAKL